MALPTGFQFSQGSLQDYVDCPRRFRLRYCQQLAWPALEAEPALEHERYLLQGAAFHRMVHRHALGVPPEQLARTISDPDLLRWWRNYVSALPLDLPANRHSEIAVSASLEEYRLLAKYDLVAVEPGGRAVIVDWKTSRKLPRRSWLTERLQSKVYPYLMVRAGEQFSVGQPLEPSQVEMVYWFAEFPAQPVQITYDAVQYAADEAYLSSLIGAINAAARAWDLDQGESHFPMTDDELRCAYCTYRSLCQRGVEAGSIDTQQAELEGDIVLDLDLIAEVDY